MRPEPPPPAPGSQTLAGVITARLARGETMPQVLAASYDAFEFIRLLARQCEDRDPRLFAAFMTTAAAAADGLDALAFSDSLPAPGEPGATVITGIPPSTDADLGTVADTLAALAAVLSRQLTRAAALAPADGDRHACRLAGRAADEIHRLMARADDHARSR